MFLTPEELRELTGRSHRAKQAEWLTSRGWPFEVRSDCRILVLRDYMTARMSGIDAQQPTVHAHKSHNFGALKAA